LVRLQRNSDFTATEQTEEQRRSTTRKDHQRPPTNQPMKARWTPQRKIQKENQPMKAQRTPQRKSMSAATCVGRCRTSGLSTVFLL